MHSFKGKGGNPRENLWTPLRPAWALRLSACSHKPCWTSAPRWTQSSAFILTPKEALSNPIAQVQEWTEAPRRWVVVWGPSARKEKWDPIQTNIFPAAGAPACVPDLKIQHAPAGTSPSFPLLLCPREWEQRTRPDLGLEGFLWLPALVPSLLQTSTSLPMKGEWHEGRVKEEGFRWGLRIKHITFPGT